jgi:hypothetical protein
MSTGIARKFALAGLAVVLGPLGLSAGTIGPEDCDSCFGGAYSLSAALLSSNGSMETFLVTYGIDLTSYDGPADATYVSALAAKVVSGPNLYDWETVAAPTNGDWVDHAGNLNNGGCDGSGAGWVCIETMGNTLQVGGTYEWLFKVTVKAGTLQDVGSIQANFAPPTGLLMSEKVAVSEAGAAELPLLLSGLGLVVFWRKRSTPRYQKSEHAGRRSRAIG